MKMMIVDIVENGIVRHTIKCEAICEDCPYRFECYTRGTIEFNTMEAQDWLRALPNRIRNRMSIYNQMHGEWDKIKTVERKFVVVIQYWIKINDK